MKDEELLELSERVKRPSKPPNDADRSAVRDLFVEIHRRDYYSMEGADVVALIDAVEMCMMVYHAAKSRSTGHSPSLEQLETETIAVPLWIIYELRRHLSQWLRDELPGRQGQQPKTRERRRPRFEELLPREKIKALSEHIRRWKSVQHYCARGRSMNQAFKDTARDLKCSPEAAKSSYKKIEKLRRKITPT